MCYNCYVFIITIHNYIFLTTVCIFELSSVPYGSNNDQYFYFKILGSSNVLLKYTISETG